MVFAMTGSATPEPDNEQHAEHAQHHRQALLVGGAGEFGSDSGRGLIKGVLFLG